MIELNDYLGKLWASRIDKYRFDILSNKISFMLTSIDGDVVSNYNLVLHQVSSCYFVNDTTDNRKIIYEPEVGDYLELTSISELEKVDIRINSCGENWIENFSANANILIEIWSKIILIEASSIEINGHVYVLGNNE